MNNLKQFSITLFAGLLIGALIAADSLSFASLIYTGPMHHHLLYGVTGSLVASGILLVMLSFFSSSNASIAATQDVFALIAALVAMSLVKTFQKNGIQIDPLPTIICALAIMALLLGLSMYFIGLMKLGKLVRFIPFPVIGGFLAGTGWLIFVSTLGGLTGTYSVLETGQKILVGEHYFVWFIPLMFGLTILISVNQIKQALIFPAMLILGLVIFYCYLAVTGITLTQALELNWMFGPFPSGALPLIPNVELFHGVQWQLLGQHVGDYFAATMLGVISLLLNISGFEMSSKQNMDIDRELKYTGIANVFSSFLGGYGGYQMLGFSKTNLDFNANTRWVSFISGIFCFSLLFIGTAPLSYLPTFLFNGLLIYIGLDFLVEWLFKIKKKISLLDYLIVISITLIIIVWGLLVGIFVGLLLSLAIFFFRYSRIPIIASMMTGRIFHSNVERNESDKDLLEEYGDSILIVNVRGYVFFGNAYEMNNRILEQLEKRTYATGVTNGNLTSSHEGHCFLVFNFSQVTGLEVSGTMSLISLFYQVQQKNIKVIFANLPDIIAKEINQFAAIEHESLDYKRFKDIDHALEWCENEILSLHQLSQHPDVEQLFRITFPEINNPSELLDYGQKLLFKKGDFMCREADQTKTLFWVASGELEAVITDAKNGVIKRLKRILAGSIVGEMALYLNLPRSASIIAVTNGVAYCFSLEILEQLTLEQPALAAAFHKSVVNVVAKRLLYANRLLLSSNS